MPTVREEVRGILRAFDDALAPDPKAAEAYRKLAIIDYWSALRMAPHHDKERNERAIVRAYEFAEKAILLGLPEEKIDVPFSNLRRHWVPRLQA